MSTRKPQDDGPQAGHDLPHMARESAQQIWLAGLGAFAKAQEEGGKVFKALVQEGMALQRNAHSAAGQQLNEAAQRMGDMAADMGARATGQWDRLEGIFEERVARALQRMGMPSAAQVQALEARIAALEQALQAQPGSGPAATARRKRSSGNSSSD